MEVIKCTVCTPHPAASSSTLSELLEAAATVLSVVSLSSGSRRGNTIGESTLSKIGPLFRSAEGDSRIVFDMAIAEEKRWLKVGAVTKRELAGRWSENAAAFAMAALWMKVIATRGARWRRRGDAVT